MKQSGTLRTFFSQLSLNCPSEPFIMRPKQVKSYLPVWTRQTRSGLDKIQKNTINRNTARPGTHSEDISAFDSIIQNKHHHCIPSSISALQMQTQKDRCDMIRSPPIILFCKSSPYPMALYVIHIHPLSSGRVKRDPENQVSRFARQLHRPQT